MMACLCNIRSIVQITFLYCLIFLFITAHPTTKRSYVHYQLNDNFYSGKPGLSLQVPKKTRCEKIKVPICENGVGYIETLLPNIFEDRNQHQAGLSLKRFHLLLDIDCSSYLRKFLCSLYFPICSLPFRNEPIQPCHHLCEKVRNDCIHSLDIFGFLWPDELNCQNFPKFGLCVGPSPESIEDNSTINTILDSFPQKSSIPYKKKQNSDTSSGVSPNLFLGINGQQKIRCERFCVDITYINLWIKVYSILCLLSTFCTICIFISDMKQYLYPERTLVWMSSCYMVLSIAYIIECFTQDPMELTLPDTTNSSNNNSSIKSSEMTWSFSNIETQWQTSSNISTHDNVLSDVQDNNEDHSCIFYFVIQNISMAAGCLWWTMASISSYLFVSRHRGFVEVISPLLHLLVWCWSSFFSIMMILVFAYPLKNGFCSLSTFLNTFFLLCCLFFFLLFKIKELTLDLIITRNWDTKMKLFSEICVFAFLAVVVCQLIELDEKGQLGDCIEDNITPKTCFQNNHRLNNVLKVKYFMMFFPGIASGFCMFLTCKNKVQCECPSDGYDNEEIYL